MWNRLGVVLYVKEMGFVGEWGGKFGYHWIFRWCR